MSIRQLGFALENLKGREVYCGIVCIDRESMVKAMEIATELFDGCTPVYMQNMIKLPRSGALRFITRERHERAFWSKICGYQFTDIIIEDVCTLENEDLKRLHARLASGVCSARYTVACVGRINGY